MHFYVIFYITTGQNDSAGIKVFSFCVINWFDSLNHIVYHVSPGEPTMLNPSDKGLPLISKCLNIHHKILN